MSNVTAGSFKVGDWLVSPQLDEISLDGKITKLEPRMMRLLVKLAESPGQVLSTQQLLDSVWSGVVVGPASVYQAVSALRKLLGDTDPKPTYIATVVRKGYRLIARVESLAPTPESAVPPQTPATRHTWRWQSAVVATLVVAAAGWIISRQRIEPQSPATPVAQAPATAALPRLAVPDFLQRGRDEEARIFAIGTSELLRNRLMTQPELGLVQNWRSYGLGQPGIDPLAGGRQIGLDYVLTGTAERRDENVQLDVRLTKIANGQALWSLSLNRPATEMTAMREEIVARIGRSLGIRISDVGNVPVEIEQHQLFMRAQLTMVTGDWTTESLKRAQALFRRATFLYPHCARCYLGLGQALVSQWSPPESHQQRTGEARTAYARSLELDPTLGEALSETASLTEDPVQADRMFRRSLELAPSYDQGYAKYGFFLEKSGRAGEAMAIYDRGLRIDPASEHMMTNIARTAGFIRGDVAKFERVMRDAMAFCPGCGGADLWLARSRLVWSGETADALKIIEKQISRSPSDFDNNPFAAAAYLEVDDPVAAESVGGSNPLALLQIAQYRHLAQRPSKLPDGIKAISFPGGPGLGFNALAEALRDEVIETRKFPSTLAALDLIFRNYSFPAPTGCKVTLVSAHVHMLAGEIEKARASARETLALLDSEAIGRPAHWFARDRASAYMILGDLENAITELQESQKRRNFVRWWYTGEIDPLFAPLRTDPRFQQLVAAARKHRVEQRALVDEMRRKGELPMRNVSPTGQHGVRSAKEAGA